MWKAPVINATTTRTGGLRRFWKAPTSHRTVSDDRGVIIIETAHRREHWRSLVALLLLTQVTFHLMAVALWSSLMVYRGGVQWVLISMVASNILVGLSLAGIAYCIWRNSSGLSIWLVLAALFWLGAVLFRVPPWSASVDAELPWFGLRVMVSNTTVAFLGGHLLRGTDLGLAQWFIFFVVTSWIVRSGASSGRSPYLWMRVAAAWFFIYALEAFYCSWHWFKGLKEHGVGWVAIPYVILPVLLGLLLRRSSRMVMPLAMLGFLLALGVTVVRFVGTAQDLYNHPKEASLLWPFLIFDMGGGIIKYSVPWIIIAAFACRFGTSALPDDGSPYPRRYCGHCHYNLHGIESNRCPECGERI